MAQPPPDLYWILKLELHFTTCSLLLYLDSFPSDCPLLISVGHLPFCLPVDLEFYSPFRVGMGPLIAAVLLCLHGCADYGMMVFNPRGFLSLCSWSQPGMHDNYSGSLLRP